MLTWRKLIYYCRVLGSVVRNGVSLAPRLRYKNTHPLSYDTWWNVPCVILKARDFTAYLLVQCLERSLKLLRSLVAEIPRSTVYTMLCCFCCWCIRGWRWCTETRAMNHCVELGLGIRLSYILLEKSCFAFLSTWVVSFDFSRGVFLTSSCAGIMANPTQSPNYTGRSPNVRVARPDRLK
jgi:hypothetical protein